MAHPLRAAPVAVLVALASAAPAQRPGGRGVVSRSDTLDALGLRARGTAALALATPFVRDANGTRVVAGPSPLAGVGLARDLSARTTLSAELRVARSPLRFRDEAGARWASGAAWQVDLVGGAEALVAGCGAGDAAGCVAARAGAGAVFLAGPRDVVPFRESGSRWGLGAEGGAAVRLATAWPLYATVAAHAYRLFGVSSPRAGPVRAGAVARGLVGVRYGR